MKTNRTAHCSSRNAERHSSRQSAFTLLELMLVLSVLVIMATLSWPRLMKTIRQQSVQGNAEQVRQILDQARVRAVEEGRILQVRYEPHGRHYVLLPFDPVEETQSQNSGTPVSTTTQLSRKEARTDPFRVYTVAENCLFHVDSVLVGGEKVTSERLGEDWIGHLENPSGVQEVAWSMPILYYPDGSATDASLVVRDRDRHYIKLHVRGLTGAVWSEPLAVMDERLGRTGS